MLITFLVKYPFKTTKYRPMITLPVEVKTTVASRNSDFLTASSK